MDYKQKLIEIIDYMNAEEINFITNFTKKEENFLSCYDNWSFKIVVIPVIYSYAIYHKMYS